MGMTAGVFHAKFETNDSFFCEKGRFLTKYVNKSIVFLTRIPTVEATHWFRHT